MFERILICTDFADGLHRLLHFVSHLGIAGIKEIVFLHVVPLWEKGIIPKVDIEKIEQAQTSLQASLGEIPADINVKIEVQSGKAVETIIKISQAYNSQLIVLGSPNRSSVVEKLAGSTMAELSRQSKIPLLIMRPQLISAYTSEELTLRCQHLFRSLLIPYNNSKESNQLIQKIKSLAQQQSEKFLQKCHLCWVLENNMSQKIPSKVLPPQAKETLSEIKADLQAIDLEVETEVREGNAVPEILDTAFMVDISAIAVSSGTIGKLQEWLVSSFAAEILRQSWYPVLYFPS